MTRIRLLPVVVFAAFALLLFKGIGLISQGGYLLVGTGEAAAAVSMDGGGHGEEKPQAPVGEPTLEDTSPVLTDAAPTLGETAQGDGGSHGAPVDEHAAPADEHAAAADTHGTPADEHTAPAEEHAAPAEEHGSGSTAPAEVQAHDEPAASEDHATDAPAEAASHAAQEPEDGAPECPLVVPAAEEHSAASAETGHGEPPLSDVACLPQDDATPMRLDDMGNKVPLTGDDGASLTEETLVSRLAERRAELDAREEELALREELLAATEKRLEERAGALAVLQESIDAMVEEKKAMEEGQFAGLVGMYETMKPDDAAKIFDALDADVLLRVARNMNPRKMAPILAEMRTEAATLLTQRLAAGEAEPTVDVPADDLAQLPQIVGQ